MDLHLMENILAIADEQSIARAAEKRFVTQSALNQQLGKLEAELGTPLFIRSRANWQPTPAGEIYLETARAILQLRRSAYNRIADCAEQSRRSLVVGLIPERGVDMFTAVYPAFHRAFPQVRLEPVECHVRAMQRMLGAGEIDVGLATVGESHRDQHRYHWMAEEEILLGVPAGNPLSAGASRDWRGAPVTDLGRFREEPFVRITRRSTLYDITQALFHEAGFVPQTLFSTASNVSKYRVAAAGLGCCLLPATYALEDGEVLYFRLPQRPAWQITLVTRRDEPVARPEELFIALCREYWENKLNRTA